MAKLSHYNDAYEFIAHQLTNEDFFCKVFEEMALKVTV